MKLFAPPAYPFEEYKNVWWAEQWLFPTQPDKRLSGGGDEDLSQQQFSQVLRARAFQAVQAAAEQQSSSGTKHISARHSPANGPRASG